MATYGNRGCTCHQFVCPTMCFPKCYELTVSTYFFERCSCSPSEQEKEYCDYSRCWLEGCNFEHPYGGNVRTRYCLICSAIILATQNIDREELNYISKDHKASLNALNAIPTTLTPEQCTRDIKCDTCTQEYGNGNDITWNFNPFDEVPNQDFICPVCEKVLIPREN